MSSFVQILSDLHGLPTKSVESNLVMLWGSINYDSALVTYLKNIFLEDKEEVVIKEIGIWLLKDGDIQEWLGSSPDGLIEHNRILKTVIEIKCPFMGGKPIPYKNVALIIYPKSCWKCFAHQQNNVTMLSGHQLALKSFL